MTGRTAEQGPDPIYFGTIFIPAGSLIRKVISISFVLSDDTEDPPGGLAVPETFAVLPGEGFDAGGGGGAFPSSVGDRFWKNLSTNFSMRCLSNVETGCDDHGQGKASKKYCKAWSSTTCLSGN